MSEVKKKSWRVFPAKSLDEQRPCIVYVTLRWDGEAGEDADAIHLCRRDGDVEDWDVTWLDEEDK